MSTGIATEIPEAIPRGFRKKNCVRIIRSTSRKISEEVAGAISERILGRISEGIARETNG